MSLGLHEKHRKMQEIGLQEKEAVTKGRSIHNTQQKTGKSSSTTTKNEPEDTRRNKLIENQSKSLKA